MRSIQNRHKRIKDMNSFINARLQRKLIKFAENPLSGSWFLGLGSHATPEMYQILISLCFGIHPSLLTLLRNLKHLRNHQKKSNLPQI